ncbi:MAG: metallophosphoesterase [Candidatus Moranbacteria bacterium]|nr:metallophosphoesterase [Candidatus Moranbacteria bacterium]
MKIFLRTFIILGFAAGLIGGYLLTVQDKSYALSDLLGQKTAILPKAGLPATPSQTAPAIQTDSPATSTPTETTDPKPVPADPAAPTGFSFAVIGDTQRFDPKNPTGGLQQAVQSIAGKNVSFLMTSGDLLSSCDGKDKCRDNLQQWKNILEPINAKTYAVMGNHDRTGRSKADRLWQDFFDLPKNGPAGFEELVYSFDFENTHVVVLNCEKPDENALGREQLNWLKSDLARNKQEHTLVFFHAPAYPVSSKQGESLDTNPDDRDELWRILQSHQVDAVFNGHEHIHSRRKIGTIHQFVFGNTDSFDHDLPEPDVADYSYRGKSFGLVTIQGAVVKVDAYAVDGTLLDSFELPR